MEEVWIADHGQGEYTVHMTQAEADGFAKYALHSVKVIRMVPAVEAPKIYLCCYKVVTPLSSMGATQGKYSGIIFDDQGPLHKVAGINTMQGLHARLLELAQGYPAHSVVIEDYVTRPVPQEVAVLLDRALNSTQNPRGWVVHH